MLWSLLTHSPFSAADNDGGGAGANTTSGADDDANPGGDKGTDKGGGKDGGSDTDAGYKAPQTQAEFDALVKDRLTRQKQALTDQIKAQLQADIDAAEATKQGDFKKLFDGEKARADVLAKELEETKRAALKSRIGSKHGLPDSIIARLAGATEDEIDADAKALAKEIGPRKAPDTEGGAGSRTGAGTQSKERKAATEPAYTFDGKQKVAWPNR